MLYFFLNEKVIETLELDELKWLTQMKVLKKRHHTDGIVVDSLPAFDDFKLTNNDIKRMQEYSKKRISEMYQVSGFKSSAIDKLQNIFETGLKAKQTIDVYCD